MKKIICFFFGHEWKAVITEEDGFEYPYKCKRCSQLGWGLNRLPKMTEKYMKENYPIPAKR